MTESLLSFSEVLLYGRLIDDLTIPGKSEEEAIRVKLAVTSNTALDGFSKFCDIAPDAGDKVIFVAQDKSDENGLYVLSKSDDKVLVKVELPRFTLVQIGAGGEAGSFWVQTAPIASGSQAFEKLGSRTPGRGLGANAQLARQLGKNPRLARIYGFAYEGTYYELAEPTIFLVHGPGTSATDGNAPGNHASRAPLSPSASGVASADYQFADDIMYWPYDKDDLTIRMDVVTGRFEQVLLDIYFGFDSPAVGGAKVSGAKVSGAKVSGAKVSGAKVSGAKVSGAKARGSGD